MIMPISGDCRAAVNRIIREEWAGPIVISKGRAHDTTNCDGFVSVEGGGIAGFALYEMRDRECEIVVLQSMAENKGIGSALIRAVMDAARLGGCRRVWLITTNDNVHAIGYYQKFGFELKAVHINALDVSRKLKPAIPLLGNQNIPIRHEFEFEILL